MIKRESVQEKLFLKEERLVIDIQNKNDCQIIMINALRIFLGGAGWISEAKGFANSFLKVMNCIEPAY